MSPLYNVYLCVCVILLVKIISYLISKFFYEWSQLGIRSHKILRGLFDIDQPQNAIRGKLINTTTDNRIPELNMFLKLCNKTQDHIFFFFNLMDPKYWSHLWVWLPWGLPEHIFSFLLFFQSIFKSFCYKFSFIWDLSSYFGIDNL